VETFIAIVLSVEEQIGAGWDRKVKIFKRSLPYNESSAAAAVAHIVNTLEILEESRWHD